MLLAASLSVVLPMQLAVCELPVVYRSLSLLPLPPGWGWLSTEIWPF